MSLVFVVPPHGFPRMSELKRRLSWALAGLAVSGACATAPASRPFGQAGLSEAEAVRLAEQFVADNGYTFAPPATDRGKVKCESIEGYETLEETLAARRGTLAGKACGVASTNLRGPGPGWTVTFCFDGWYAKQRRWNGDLSLPQRAVVMRPDGSGLRMAHEELLDRPPSWRKLNDFQDQPPRREIGAELALFAATQYVFRTGFIPGYEQNPERDWPLPSEPTARVKATPRLPLYQRPCAVVPRDLRRNEAGWSVGFCYNAYVMADRHLTLANADQRLRFVTMDRYGEGIDMLDEDGDWAVPGLQRLREPPRCGPADCR
jgi:hypothetical protein